MCHERSDTLLVISSRCGTIGIPSIQVAVRMHSMDSTMELIQAEVPLMLLLRIVRDARPRVRTGTKNPARKRCDLQSSQMVVHTFV